MQRASYILFIFLLIFSPLAFGTVETWSLSILETTTAISFLLLFLPLLMDKKTGLNVPGIIPLFLLLCFMLLQLLPLPIALVKLLSPGTWEIYKPLLDLDPDQKFIPLTVHRKSSLLMLFTFSAYGLMYLMTVYHCSNADRLKQTVTIVTALAIFIATEAIIQKLTSPSTIYWFRSSTNNAAIGPWVYSNHFAGFMGMLFPLTIALFLFYQPQVTYDRTLREKFISIMSIPGANRHLLLGTGALLIVASIFLSRSRGGIITLSLAFLFFILFSARATKHTGNRWAILLTIFAMLLISLLGWRPIIDKFVNLWGETGLDTSERLPVMLDSINIIRNYPLFGSGFGTFIHVYPSVRTVPGTEVFDHALNDYIELLATGGLIGLFLFGWFVVSVLNHTFRVFRKRRDRYTILITSGALTGMLAFLFHSLADFQIYNGANGFYFFFISGLAVSAVSTRLQYQTRPSFLKERKYLLLPPSLLALVLLISCPWYKLNMYRADNNFKTMRSLSINKPMLSDNLNLLYATVDRSVQLDPLEAKYPSRLGLISTALHEKKHAQTEYLQTCMIQPTSGICLQKLALSLDPEMQNLKNNLLATALKRDPFNHSLYLRYSEWLLIQNKRPEAFIVLNKAIKKISWEIPAVIDFMIPLRFSISEVEQQLVLLPVPWFEVGKKMEKLKQLDKAEFFYRRAIEITGKEQAQAAYFDRLYKLYLQQEKEKKAIETLRMGISYLPDNSQFRIHMGEYYLKQGILYRAVQEYTKALELEPNNISIRRKLESIKQ